MGVISSRLSGRVSPTKLNDEPMKTTYSSSNESKKTSNTNEPVRTTTNTLVNKLIIVWLDANVNDEEDVYQNALSRLRRFASSIEKFTDANQCLEYLNRSKNEKILMVISNDFLAEIWTKIQTMPQIHSVYVISSNGEQKSVVPVNSEKVKGVFTTVEPISGSVRRDTITYRQDALVMSIIPSQKYNRKDLPHLNQLFIYWMLVKMIIREMKTDKENKKRVISDFAAFCRTKYFANETEMKIIDEFEQHYHQHSPIWWYTRDCFLSPMLNQAFQSRDIEVIIRMSFFIHDIFHEMEKVQIRSYKTTKLPVMAYRSQNVTNDDFEKIKSIKGHILSFNNFVIADPDYEASMEVVKQAQTNNSGVTILFAIKVDSKSTSTPYISLQNICHIPEQGKLILFSIHSIFRINEIKHIEGQIYQIDLILAASSDEQVTCLTELLRQETRIAPNWLKLAILMSNIHDYDQSREVYFTLLELSADDPLKMARIYNELGLIDDEIGDYASALEFYQKAVEIRRQQLPPNHRSLSISYNNIGEVQRQLGDYNGALSNHQKTLHIKQKILNPNDLSLATTYNNIGLANEALGEFPTALAHYQRALTIKQRVLPSDHQELAITYNNIGELQRLMGYYKEALTSFEQALHIRLKKYRPKDSTLAVPYNNLGLIHRELGNYTTALNFFKKSLDVKLFKFKTAHPSLAFSYNNIGDLQHTLGEYNEALESYQKALDIQIKAFNENHPDVATTYTNIGAVHQAIGQYPEARSFYEKAVAIRKRALPENHPALGTCYNNIGHLHQLLGQHEEALEWYNKTLKLQEKSLQRHHPSIATTYNNLGDVYRKLGDNNKALTLYKRSLDIKKKSLPADHPTLVITYNNIGVIHQATQNYPAALEYYKTTLEVQKKTLSANHPEMAAVYNNLGVTHQSMKEYPNALQYYEKALEIQEKSLPANHPDKATTLNSLATVYVSMGEFDKAVETEQRAVDIASKILPSDHPNLKIFNSYLAQMIDLVKKAEAQENS